MTRVLVTGATTTLGARLVDVLARDPAVEAIVATGIEPPERAFALLPRTRATYVQADLRRSRSARELLFGPAASARVDTVLYGATHRGARDDARAAHALDVDAAQEFLRLCEQHPTVTRFVYRSFAEVYRLRVGEASVLDEQHPLELSPRAPQWIRNRVEADLSCCARMGMGPLRVLVLRCADCLVEGAGSQLYDYLRSRVCLRPLGYDPMLGVVALDDLVDALRRACAHPSHGVFNVPGREALPLSRAIALAGRRDVPLPGLALGPLYRARAYVRRTDFRYDLNRERFHFGAVLDGRRAAAVLGYRPTQAVDWSAVAMR